jgi:nondiscriminating aspartyl-tRNA synthetase
MKAVTDLVGEKCEFESPEIIKERFGLIIGGIPPFGHLLNLDTYFDEKLSEQGNSAFNCGLVNESRKMKSKDLIAVVQPKLARFTKE